METYITLLRGVNVSGRNVIKMAELKNVFLRMGLHKVNTYIQSGNIVFITESASKEQLRQQITQQIKSEFGYDVPTIVLKRNDLERIVQQNPLIGQNSESVLEDNKMYYTFLSDVPDSEMIRAVEQFSCNKECISVIPEEKIVYIYAANGYGKTKLTTVLIEKKMNCKATTRNLKTLTRLLELSNS